MGAEGIAIRAKWVAMGIEGIAIKEIHGIRRGRSGSRRDPIT